MFFNCRILSAVKLFLPDVVVKKSRQVSNEKVTRSSSSVVTQSVKRPGGKFHRKSYNPALFKTFHPFFFFAIKEQPYEQAFCYLWRSHSLLLPF